MQILAYERSSRHRYAETSVLFGDGHVEFEQMPVAVRMIQEQQAKKK